MNLMISQIVNLKMICDDLGLRKCYQCGGETLNPMVSESSDVLALVWPESPGFGLA